MIDMGSIAAVLSSLNTAKEIAKGMVNLHTAAEIQAATIDLNGKIIDAQQQLFSVNQAQTAQADRIRELESQIAAMENWNTEKQRYQMATPYSGVTVYAVKKSMSEGEPPHYLCANCFQSRKRSILANTTAKDGHIAIVCAACKFIAQTRWRGLGPAKYAEDIAGPE